MVTRDNLPKVINDIQDTVSELCEDFEVTNEPITDDSQALHKLCAKLEFLFTSSLKEKSILGVQRSYWNWIYAALKGTKGLSDGVRYVRGNKEVRTAAGRGRLFVRYCLVHHTLADSLQNCIMDKAATSQHMNPKSVITNPMYSSPFVIALYDLNSVNFDLNSKGYDLDSGWPTFASKNPSQVSDKWEIQSNAESISSASAAIPLESPRAHGSDGSGLPVVDRRVEELVFEMDQSDRKMKEQQDIIVSLEAKTEHMVKSTGEKEGALSDALYDLEAKNRVLHDTIDNLSSDFQAREEEWRKKHDIVVGKLNAANDKNKTLSSKLQQLEQDKRGLEDSVDQLRSDSSFVTPPNSLASGSMSVCLSSSSSAEMGSKLEELTSKNLSLAERLADSQAQCAHFESQLKENLSHAKELASWSEKVKKQQTKTEEAEKRVIEIEAYHQTFVESLKEALQLDEQEVFEPHTIVENVMNLRLRCETVEQGVGKPGEDEITRTVALQGETDRRSSGCESVQLLTGTQTCQVKEMEDEVAQLKVELEVMSTRTAVRIAELEMQVSLTNQEKETQQKCYQELLADLKATQENLNQTEEELDAARQRCHELKRKESTLTEELASTKQHYEDEICENEFLLEELQAEMKHQIALNETLDQKLEKEKVKCNQLNGELVIADSLVKTFTNELEETRSTLVLTEDAVSQLQTDMKRINDTEFIREKQMNFMSGQLEGFFENIRLLEESDNLEKVEVSLQGSEADLSSVDTDALGEWDSSQNKFFDVLQKYKETKSKLATLEKEHESLSEESQIYKSETEVEMEKLREELSEVQSHNDIHLVTIKDLSDKHKVLQDAKAANSDEIDKLQYERNELTETLKASENVTDELRLRVMEESARRVELEEKVKLQDSDIESLKDKVTQLLLDKDTLWKEKEELRDRFNEHPGDPKEPDWMHDDEVDSCTGCDEAFSLTLRRHHCRICGKIFCKNCCGKWKERRNKKIRICSACFETSSLNLSDLTTDESSQIASPPAETPSKECEEIDGEEMDKSGVAADDDMFSDFDGRTPSVKSQDNITVPARREVHLPVHVERAGIVLHWEISTDRDINFKLSYAPTEEDALQELVPVRRIDSHIEPFTGDIAAKKEGVYTLILDNTYSRFTAKQVLYTLRTFE